MVEYPVKWREGPQQITSLVQDGSPQLQLNPDNSNPRQLEFPANSNQN